MRHHGTPHAKHRYRGRLLGTLVVVLGALILLVRGWPVFTSSSSDAPFSDRATEPIQIQDIQPTSQSQELTPPPPAPPPPIVVPNDEPINERLEFSDATLTVEDPGPDDRLQRGTADTPTTARQPDTNPRLFRAVQPEYPSAARENNVRARVEVAVEVSVTGRVKQATIVKRWRLSEEGRVRPVAHLKYGLEKAALGAAQRSRFRPAQHDGSPVASRTTITFEFGPSSH